MNGAASQPALSVLIATHGRRDALRRCLESLCEQDEAPGAFEVVVADDGSSDGTADMVEALDTPFELRVLRLPKTTKANALNSALAAARAPACLRVDDDLIAGPSLVSQHLAAQSSGARVLALGRLIQVPPPDSDAYARAFADQWNRRYEDLEHRTPDWADCYGANFSAPRELLREVGGFVVRPIGEDIDIGLRLVRAGCEVRYLPRAEAVHHDHKRGPAALDSQRRFGMVAVARFAHASPDAESAAEVRRRLLGWFGATTPREVMLRRVLIRLRVPPRFLARAGILIPAEGARRVWFGFVSRYAFWLGVRNEMGQDEWMATTQGVAVLMYHGFTDHGRGGRYLMPARSFRRQLWVLRLLRRRFVSLEELAACLREGRVPPPRSVVLTIDDGYRDNLEVALPLLRRHGFRVTLFMVSRRLGGVNDWDASEEVSGRPLLSARELREMREAGIEIGAHTRAHPSLPDLSDEVLADEVEGSREDLEAALGSPVATFAYPYGRFDERAVEAVRRAGFAAACTVDGRPALLGDDPALIPRIEVMGSDSPLRFVRKALFGWTS